MSNSHYVVPPLSKLCDLFTNIIEVVITDQALLGAPCHELSRSQWEGAQFIHRHEDCAIRELAEWLGVSHPAAVKLVERLQRKNLITRHESSRDRRVVHLRLSDEGNCCVNHVRQYRAQALDKIIERMSAEDNNTFMQGLRLFMEAALHDQQTAEAICLHCGAEHLTECMVQMGKEKTL